MTWYRVNVALHVLSMCVWFGHMIFWSIIVGPMTRRWQPPAAGDTLRQVSHRCGGLGWPSLGVLVITGAIMLAYRGVTWQQMASGELFLSPFGRLLRLKLLLVAGMVLYQGCVGHRPAPRLIYVQMLLALAILGLSVVLVRFPLAL